MVIREAGLLFRGFSLINASYHKTSEEKVDMDLRSGLLTALINFAENTLSKPGLVEYFEMNKFVIAFIEDKIKSDDSVEPEILISYAILDKEKKIDRHLSKVIIPSLNKVSKKFKSNFEGRNLSEVSQFKDFKKTLDKIFGLDVFTLDEKLKGTFFE